MAKWRLRPVRFLRPVELTGRRWEAFASHDGRCELLDRPVNRPVQMSFPDGRQCEERNLPLALVCEGKDFVSFSLAGVLFTRVSRTLVDVL